MSSLYSWSRFALRTAAAAANVAGRPTKLIFIVTKRCYSRCVYCDIWKIKDAPGGLDGELSLNEVQAVVAYLHALINLHLLDGSLLERRGIAAPGDVALVEITRTDAYDLIGRVLEILPRPAIRAVRRIWSAPGAWQPGAGAGGWGAFRPRRRSGARPCGE